MIPRDAREVYLNERGEAVAFCPKDGLGLTDLERARFYEPNRRRMARLLARAREKGPDFVAVCIDVDDPSWTWLADALLPGFNWSEIRDRGERPVARGVVPRGPIVETVEAAYPAALPAPGGAFIAVFAAGGVLLLGDD